MYEVGDWIKCTKDATGYCTVGQSYKIVGTMRDRTLITVEYAPGKHRALWTPLKEEKYHECIAVEAPAPVEEQYFIF